MNEKLLEKPDRKPSQCRSVESFYATEEREKPDQNVQKPKHVSG